MTAFCLSSLIKRLKTAFLFNLESDKVFVFVSGFSMAVCVTHILTVKKNLKERKKKHVSYANEQASFA